MRFREGSQGNLHTEKEAGGGLDKVGGRGNRSGAPQAKYSMCEDPEGEGTWQLQGSWEVDPQQTWHCRDGRRLALMAQMVHPVRASAN